MSFKFIDIVSTSISADAATELSKLEVSGVFKSSSKTKKFILGNTGSGIAAFSVAASGVNDSIVNDVTFSLDGSTFSTSVQVSGVPANGVTSPIHVKFTPGDDLVTSIGTFLIRVDES